MIEFEFHWGSSVHLNRICVYFNTKLGALKKWKTDTLFRNKRNDVIDINSLLGRVLLRKVVANCLILFAPVKQNLLKQNFKSYWGEQKLSALNNSS